jgi:hypothetical protein
MSYGTTSGLDLTGHGVWDPVAMWYGDNGIDLTDLHNVIYFCKFVEK